MQLAEFKEFINNALKSAAFNGIKICPNSWGIQVNSGGFVFGSRDKMCCPIGAALIQSDVKPNTNDRYIDSRDVGIMLDIELEKIEAFTEGVDNEKIGYSSKRYRRWHQFGKEIRKKYRL